MLQVYQQVLVMINHQMKVLKSWFHVNKNPKKKLAIFFFSVALKTKFTKLPITMKLETKSNAYHVLFVHYDYCVWNF